MSKKDSYLPNGTPDDIAAGIIHSVGRYWVSNEGTKAKPSYHVWMPAITHSVADSAYLDLSLAIARCNYLHKYQSSTPFKHLTQWQKLHPGFSPKNADTRTPS